MWPVYSEIDCMDSVSEGVVPKGSLNKLTSSEYDQSSVGPQVEVNALQKPACKLLAILPVQ